MNRILWSVWYFATLIMLGAAMFLWWLPIGGSFASWGIISAAVYILSDLSNQYYNDNKDG